MRGVEHAADEYDVVADGVAGFDAAFEVPGTARYQRDTRVAGRILDAPEPVLDRGAEMPRQRLHGPCAGRIEFRAMSSAAPATPLLFTPLRLRGLTARNRVVVSPMCQYSSERGGPTDYHLVHLGKFAMGGAGIVFCEETAVEARGRKSHHCAGIYDDAHIPGYRRINEFIRAQGAVPAIQIGHGGRKGSGCAPWEGYRPLTAEDAKQGHAPWRTVSASAIPASAEAPVPHALTTGEIADVVASWRTAAARALDAGYDVVEVHAAHGYLIHQFLSPLANRRDDAYGRDLQGRMRLCLEIVEAVRGVWPADRPVFMRVSAVDGVDGAWSSDDTVALARAARERGVDFVTTSSGGIAGPGTATPVPRVPGYHVPYAAKVRREAGVGTIAVGLITEARHAEEILRNGEADLIALARELLWNPNWPAHAARELGVPAYLDLLPRGYAWWLKRREDIREVTRKAAEKKP
jgi:2,4-dienoyl-CoA reductase-like NADH-dependent reductase (Old Yellow Enzyme family)